MDHRIDIASDATLVSLVLAEEEWLKQHPADESATEQSIEREWALVFASGIGTKRSDLFRLWNSHAPTGPPAPTYAISSGKAAR
jgi:hypothetical protein